MEDMDTAITLIGTRLAKEGEEFFFEGEAPECEQCKLKNTCMGLEKGRKYRIVKVRNQTTHECFVHDTGALVVDVIKAPIIAAIDSKKAIKGATIRYQVPNCDGELDSETYDLCHPKGLRNGDKCTINKVMENVDIESEQPGSLKKVELLL
ncbi:UPF0179 family protein [Methanococcoides orientis]|uniref:UPF0179 family protein n=1 Tax=Methanococcoides orientis TaxID=2822137 RepID=UPI001E35AB1C|nr:UPF0179 family protein [Methanococcoides orientis]UGV39764.1 UPF0179 family protein [Methanococcoides orientis]